MKRLLYHASPSPIPDPNPFHGRKNADMGQAFYLSSDESFARIWAKQGWHINVYEWDEEGLAIQTLEQDEDWFKTIFENRNYAKDPYSHFDAIIAPIANDTIFDLVGLLTSGFVPNDTCLKVLRQGPKFTQICPKKRKSGQKPPLPWLQRRFRKRSGRKPQESRIDGKRISGFHQNRLRQISGSLRMNGNLPFFFPRREKRL